METSVGIHETQVPNAPTFLILQIMITENYIISPSIYCTTFFIVYFRVLLQLLKIYTKKLCYTGSGLTHLCLHLLMQTQ